MKTTTKKANRPISPAIKLELGNLIAKQYKATQVDPTMLQINLLINNSKLSVFGISQRSGVSITCLHKWLNRKTRRPQAITMKYVLRALGYDLKITPSAGHNLGPEMEE